MGGKRVLLFLFIDYNVKGSHLKLCYLDHEDTESYV